MKTGYINVYTLITDYNGTCFNLHTKYNIVLFLLWLHIGLYRFIRSIKNYSWSYVFITIISSASGKTARLKRFFSVSTSRATLRSASGRLKRHASNASFRCQHPAQLCVQLQAKQRASNVYFGRLHSAQLCVWLQSKQRASNAFFRRHHFAQHRI